MSRVKGLKENNLSRVFKSQICGSTCSSSVNTKNLEHSFDTAPLTILDDEALLQRKVF